MGKYDVVIAGAGIGGIIAGNFLAKSGVKTLILEQSHQTGGNMSGFRRKGFYFDGGDQSFESLGIVFPLLKELGLLDKVTWHKARFRMVSEDFDFRIDSFDAVESALMQAFPDEPGIPVLFREVREVSRFLEANYTPWSFPLLENFSVAGMVRMLPWFPKLRRWLTYSYREKACRLIKNPALRGWFTGIGYYHMPFIFFAGFWHIWMKDYWYPEGGMQALHDLLARNFTGLGGELRRNTRVERIEYKNRKARAAVCSGGERFEAEDFIYAGDYRRMVNSVLGPELFKPSFVKKITNVRLTEELVNVYLGLESTPRELESRLNAQHVFYFPNYEAIFPNDGSPLDIHKRMWVVLNHFGLENPGGAPEGNSSVVLQTYSSYNWQNQWRNGGGTMPRTREYRSLKEDVAEQLIQQAENILPGLGGKVIYRETGSPLSGERFSLNSHGSSGGWCYEDGVSPVFRFPGFNLIKTPLANLKTCGHYSLWPGGVISAALSGKISANLIMGKKPFSAV